MSVKISVDTLYNGGVAEVLMAELNKVVNIFLTQTQNLKKNVL